MIGRLVGLRYRLTRELGKGGMGAVYEAVHVATGRRVALKLMNAPSGNTNDSPTDAQITRFQREAVAAGRLDTQHAVQVYDAGTDEETREPYLAMELLEGEDVSSLIQRLGPLREELALAILMQACMGLQKAHDAGVIHRDIKPSNLFLSKTEYGDYNVKLLDFGIAKVVRDESVDDGAGTLTQTGVLVGSPHYMSPEQAKGLKTIDHRSDLWSLGILLHKCLSGRTPFDGTVSFGYLIVAVCTEDIASVQEHAPWVRPEVALVVRQALRRDPSLRFQSAMQLCEALKPYLPRGPRITEDMLRPLTAQETGVVMPRRSDFPTQATPPGTLIPPPATTTGTVVLSTTPQPIDRPRARRRWPIAVGVALALAIASAFVARPKLRSGSNVVHAAMPSPPPLVAPPPVVSVTSARVAVSPATATIEVDGSPASIDQGFVTVVGALGSTHRIRIALAGHEATHNVALTEDGAIPSKLVLETPKPITSTPRAPVAPASPPAKHASPKSSAAPAKTAGFDHTFE